MKTLNFRWGIYVMTIWTPSSVLVLTHQIFALWPIIVQGEAWRWVFYNVFTSFMWVWCRRCYLSFSTSITAFPTTCFLNFSYNHNSWLYCFTNDLWNDFSQNALWNNVTKSCVYLRLQEVSPRVLSWDH